MAVAMDLLHVTPWNEHGRHGIVAKTLGSSKALWASLCKARSFDTSTAIAYHCVRISLHLSGWPGAAAPCTCGHGRRRRRMMACSTPVVQTEKECRLKLTAVS